MHSGNSNMTTFLSHIPLMSPIHTNSGLCHGFVLQTSENKWRWPNNPNWSSMMYKRHRDVVHKDRSTFADVDYDVWELKK